MYRIAHWFDIVFIVDFIRILFVRLALSPSPYNDKGKYYIVDEDIQVLITFILTKSCLLSTKLDGCIGFFFPFFCFFMRFAGKLFLGVLESRATLPYTQQIIMSITDPSVKS